MIMRDNRGVRRTSRFETRLAAVLRVAYRSRASGSAWPELIVADIPAVNEFAEKVTDQGMPDRLSAGIGLKIPFRRVSSLIGCVYENMIPGLDLTRLRLVRLIPLLVGPAL